jgi:threonylcarbamoyladenosine tRNA methylthiotransferase MtaB
MGFFKFQRVFSGGAPPLAKAAMRAPDDLAAPGVAFATLGCKVNQSEVQAATEDLAARGYRICSAGSPAEVVVINTCTVTHVAEQKSRQLIRRVRRDNPRALVVLTGCYAQLSSTPSPEVDLVVGLAEKDHLVELIAARRPLPPGLRPAEREETRVPRTRTRAFVKAQDGCDCRCTYCIVPAARGRSRSVPLAAVRDAIQVRLKHGFREIVLTGVNIARYGRDLTTGEDLKDLISMALSRPELERLRVTSIEPQDFHAGLLECWEDSRLARHFHLPLQSGCDSTLARMGRPYTTAQFAEIVARIRAKLPDAAISTDLIVGFPGETEAEFGETARFLRAMAFSKIHVFPYSPRRGTPAAMMACQVPSQEKKSRGERARTIGDEVGRAFRQRFVGREMIVLWERAEQSSDGQCWTGLTDNYIRVNAACAENLANTITRVRLTAIEGEGMAGEIVENDDEIDLDRVKDSEPCLA